jgi:peptidyl-prolyl cis-trans isomerase C
MTAILKLSLNRETAMTKASARHILVKTQDQCNDIKNQIVKGSDFSDMAKNHSLCPSGRQGGALGEFYPGQMVPEFDQVVFRDEIGKVHGPVQTQFGFHLIEITSRSE